jgi:hypothetical protein
MVLDGALVAAGDEDHVGDARGGRLDRVLIRLSTMGSIPWGSPDRQKRLPRPTPETPLSDRSRHGAQ